MNKANKKQSPSLETQQEAMAIAKANQRPGQTKDQTKLIAQGIQKGIEQYKKQYKAKSRELDKKRKKLSQQDRDVATQSKESIEIVTYRQHWLPWTLLILSWLGFIAYLMTA